MPSHGGDGDADSRATNDIARLIRCLQGMQLLVATVAGLLSLNLQDLTLAELRGRSRQPSSRLFRDESIAPSKAQ